MGVARGFIFHMLVQALPSFAEQRARQPKSLKLDVLEAVIEFAAHHSQAKFAAFTAVQQSWSSHQKFRFFNIRRTRRPLVAEFAKSGHNKHRNRAPWLLSLW